jgi:hypothetical protein
MLNNCAALNLPATPEISFTKRAARSGTDTFRTNRL